MKLIESKVEIIEQFLNSRINIHAEYINTLQKKLITQEETISQIVEFTQIANSNFDKIILANKKYSNAIKRLDQTQQLIVSQLNKE